MMTQLFTPFPAHSAWRLLRALFALPAAASLTVLGGCSFRAPPPDGSGTIECTQVDLAPQVSGRLIAGPPEEGERIAAGAVIARIDTADHELRPGEAEAAHAVARAQLDLVLAGAREEDVQRAREQLREAEAMARAAEADRQRILAVFNGGSATQKQKDDAQAQADRTAAAAAAAGQNLARLVKGSRREEILLAAAQVDQGLARTAIARKALADCTVTSAVPGIITTRVRETGEFVSAGSPVATLSLLDDVWLSVYVPEPSLAGVKLGQRARVKVDGRAGLFEGRVTFISPVAEFTPRNVQTPDERAKLVYRVKIALPNTNGIFKIGMPADGYLND